MVSAVELARILQAARRRPKVLHNHSAAQCYWLASYWARALLHDSRRPDQMEAYAGLQHVVRARDRPRRHRHSERARKTTEEGRAYTARLGPREIRRAHLAVGSRVRRRHPLPASAARLLV